MSFFVTSDGLRLHYTDTGSGQPVLCLPGLTRSGLDFSFVAPHLTGQRMITLDARGRGASQHDPDFMSYNVLRESRDVIELLDHLGLPQVTVLGTSRGGLIAMALAASHPERLAAVVLNDVGPVVGAQGIARIIDYVGRPPVAQDYDSAARALQAAMADEFPDVPLSVWRQQVEFQYAQTADGLALRYDPALRKALLEQAATGATPDLWLFFEALAQIPLGVIRGANSDILGRDTLEEMARRHPDLIWAEVPDRGHAPFLNEADSLRVIHAILERAVEPA